jgi:hypothetical protein
MALAKCQMLLRHNRLCALSLNICDLSDTTTLATAAPIAPTEGASGEIGGHRCSMPDSLFAYALFILPLFLIGACLLTGLPIAVNVHDYYKNRGPHSVRRPDPDKTARVVIKHDHLQPATPMRH